MVLFNHTAWKYETLLLWFHLPDYRRGVWIGWFKWHRKSTLLSKPFLKGKEIVYLLRHVKKALRHPVF